MSLIHIKLPGLQRDPLHLALCHSFTLPRSDPCCRPGRRLPTALAGAGAENRRSERIRFFDPSPGDPRERSRDAKDGPRRPGVSGDRAVSGHHTGGVRDLPAVKQDLATATSPECLTLEEQKINLEIKP